MPFRYVEGSERTARSKSLKNLHIARGKKYANSMNGHCSFDKTELIKRLNATQIIVN